MKTKLITLGIVITLAFAIYANAEDAKSTQPAPKPGSAEFERMKSLVGTWTAKVDMGQGPVDMAAHYRLLAAGSVLEERVFEGTPNEMITMFYDKGGKLAATHYCVFGNRPQMLLKSSDAKSIEFSFDKICGINVKKESHMHAMKFTFEDSDNVTTTCQALVDGKEMPACPAKLKRVKE